MAGKVHKIDLASQAFGRNPFPTYASLREAGPVFQTRLPLLGKTWVATTYQAASEVLKDEETFVMEAKKVGKTFSSSESSGCCRAYCGCSPTTCSTTTTRTTAACVAWSNRPSAGTVSRTCAAASASSVTASSPAWPAGKRWTCCKNGPGPCPWRSSASYSACPTRIE